MRAIFKQSVSTSIAGKRLNPISRIFILFLFLCSASNLYSQRMVLSTNALKWGTLSPNVAVEFPLNNYLSLELATSGNPFRLKENLYFKHISLQPELKYWFQNLLSRHYAGITLLYSSYDVGITDKAYYGDAYAAGLTYGYQWILSRRWNLELSAGAGVARYQMVKYTPGKERGIPDESGWRIVPMNIGVSFVYIFK